MDRTNRTRDSSNYLARNEPRSSSVAGTLSADLFLLHAPSVLDFRERDDVIFAYLSDSDSVNVTSVYEMYPLGFLAIQQQLRERGFEAAIVNIASLMLMHPEIDIEKLLSRLHAPVFGFDLHWMTQCHGSIELAERVKAIHPEALTIFGGLSATYYADELITYPAVDVVVKGYDTLVPMTMLMEATQGGGRAFDHIPNLVYKQGGSSRSTSFGYKPTTRYNDVAIDWSFYQDAPSHPATSKLIMTLPNTGCAMDCPWCGGSRYAYRSLMGIRKTVVGKSSQRITDELRSMGEAAASTSIYALQCYSESKDRLHRYLDVVRDVGYRSVSFEQTHLTPEDTLRRMGRSTQAYIMLSPESHDPVISKLAGRGHYTMEEMEEWIPGALDAGIAGIMVWFFIGMPRQSPDSVMETVAYAESLLKKFEGGKVLPLLCPMVPFLDPGSRFFEQPDRHGYRIFHRTLEEHRQAMVEPVWRRRLNFETRWMSRRQLQETTYEAIARLVAIKGELGLLPASSVRFTLGAIDDTVGLLANVEHALEADGTLSTELRERILIYNRKSLAYSSDQIIPMPRPFGGRWFDDFTIPPELISECSGGAIA